MDVNARINWVPGMELSSKTFLALDGNLHHRRVLSFRIAAGGNYGIIPGTAFSADGIFAKGNFEIPLLECTAVLPSGEMICMSEPLVTPMPRLAPGEYFLCVSFGEGDVEYERDGIGYIRPEYVSGVYRMDELEGADVFPVMKFVVSDGTCSVIPTYVPPCFSMASLPVFAEFAGKVDELLLKVIEHVNMPAGDGKASLLRCRFELGLLKEDSVVSALISTVGKICGNIDYFVFPLLKDGKKPSAPKVSNLDVAEGFRDVISYLKAALAVLDATPLVDDSIDYDRMKAEITADLYARVMPELTESLSAKLRETLNGDIREKLSAALKDYLDGTFRREVEASLKTTLSEELRSSLYDSLYKALYDALFVPEQVETQVFIPNI